MPNITDIEQARKKRKRRNSRQKMVSFLVLIVIVIVAFTANRIIGVLDPGYYIAEIFSPGDGYPIAVPGSYIDEVKTYRGNLGLLSDINFTVFSPSARQVVEITHSYSNPSAQVAGDKVLLFDRGGKKFKVSAQSDKLYEKEIAYPIVCGAVSGDGKAAVSSGAQGYISEVVVYSSGGEEIFKWSSLDSYVMLVAFSADAKGMVVAGVSANEGSVVTRLSAFRFDSQEALWSSQLKDCIPYSLAYIGDRVQLVTDHSVVSVGSDGGVKAEYDYEGKILSSFAVDGGGRVSLAFERAGSIAILGSDLKETGKIEAKDGIRDISMDNGTVAALTGGGVARYHLDGSAKGDSREEIDGRRILCAGGRIYIVTSNGAYQYDS